MHIPAVFTNPVTGQLVYPGKIIGYRRDGRPIYVIAGGSGEGGGGGGAGDSGSGGGTAGGESGQGGNDGQGDDTNTSGKPNIEGEFDAARASRAIQAAREAEKKAKGDAKAAKDQVTAILAAAGLKPDGTKDPAEQLKEASAKATGAEAKARNAQIETAVLRRAGKAGGDPDALLDSTSFMNSMKDIDPDAADFGDQVTAAIKAAVKSNGKLAATGQGPGRQGADHTGGGTSRGRSANLTDAVKRKLGG
ncbi:hypothetical protein [Micromonospora sp. RTGN7]|uniref:hypothetical protein n=1 Tax=Micromonospora sp. RTGN7 TaxID=3016526 RepID=UPI0029FF50FE|nr:hypothetical protein [Micromonospora sp. RTGN7]